MASGIAGGVSASARRSRALSLWFDALTTASEVERSKGSGLTLSKAARAGVVEARRAHFAHAV